MSHDLAPLTDGGLKAMQTGKRRLLLQHVDDSSASRRWFRRSRSTPGFPLLPPELLELLFCSGLEIFPFIPYFLCRPHCMANYIYGVGYLVPLKFFFLFVTMLVSFAWRVSIFSSTFSVSTAISFWEKLGFRFLVLASTSTTSDIVLALSLLFIFRALSVARARIRKNKFETGLTSVNRRLVNRGLNAR